MSKKFFHTFVIFSAVGLWELTPKPVLAQQWPKCVCTTPWDDGCSKYATGLPKGTGIYGEYLFPGETNPNACLWRCKDVVDVNSELYMGEVKEGLWSDDNCNSQSPRPHGRLNRKHAR